MDASSVNTPNVDIIQLVHATTTTPGYDNFAQLLSIPSIQLIAQKKDEWLAFRLLEIFAFKDYTDYIKEQDSLPPLTASQITNLRVITVAKMLKERHSVTFAVLANALGFASTSEVEVFLIDALNHNVLQGNMDQDTLISLEAPDKRRWIHAADNIVRKESYISSTGDSVFQDAKSTFSLESEANDLKGSSAVLAYAFDSRWSIPRIKDYRTYIVFLGSLIAIVSNMVILVFYVKTLKFGKTFEFNKLDSENVITVISLFSKFLSGISALLGGWTLSQLYSRALFEGGKVGLAELESLGVFTSIGTQLVTVPSRLLGKHYGTLESAMRFSLYLVAALILQLYSTACVTLAVPTLVSVVDPTATYVFEDRPFMLDIGIGMHCGDDGNITAERQKACLGNMLVGTALFDIGYFHNDNKPQGYPNQWPTPDYWMKINSIYAPMRLQMSNYIGPLNGVDVSSGAILFGQNRGTIEGLAGYFGPVNQNYPYDDDSRRIDNSINFSVDFNTTTPILTSQCMRTDAPPNSTTFVIGGLSYTLPKAIATMDDGYIVGQTTTDNTTLIISYRTNDYVHCAVNLGMRTGTITLQKNDGLISWPSETPWTWGDLRSLVDSSPKTLIAEFADIWLYGMGYSEIPIKDALSMYFASTQLSVGTGNTQYDSFLAYVEYFILTIFANSVSLGFAQERPPPPGGIPPPGIPISRRYYTATKTQYYVGTRSKLRWTLFVIVIFDSLFVAWCLLVTVFMSPVWMPDWADPAALFCTSMGSKPAAAFHESCSGVVKEDAFRQKLSLSVQDGHLAFEASSSISNSVSFTTATDSDSEEQLELLPSSL